jgi:hypothetical protein
MRNGDLYFKFLKKIYFLGLLTFWGLALLDSVKIISQQKYYTNSIGYPITFIIIIYLSINTYRFFRFNTKFLFNILIDIFMLCLYLILLLFLYKYW